MSSIEFQLYDWREDHNIIEQESDDEDEIGLGDFIIHTFGRCQDGKSVYAKVINYTPYFYILIPNSLQNKSKTEIDFYVKKLDNYLKKECKLYTKFRNTLKELQLVRLKRAEGFMNEKEFYFVRLVFNNADGMKKYKYFLELNDVFNHRFRLYEANLPPMLRCFHIREISGCSWIETSDYELVNDDKESLCDIEIIVDWRKLNPIKKDSNAPLRIASFDIECNSIDGEFPQAKRKGDCVIQIGVTYTYLGQSIPYRQYIACLKETSNVDNAIVESYDTEQELMLAFLEEITNSDCDIITGYNIFFFDEKYMFDRCKEILDIETEMSYMSKLKNFKCNFKEMKLASSALGENLLRFWDTPGRIHIDLMKDVQKTFNLSSYKLDSVASNFIRGNVISYNKIENNNYKLNCNSIQDIFIGDFIHLEINKGFVSDEIGDKYIVTDLDKDNKSIIIKGDDKLINELDNLKNTGTICWSQAKDDVGPKDIFRLQKGSPDDRAIVAKYCIKDCRLVNLLINKLEVVTKNLEMANVCYVPLSYLFIRGQGIKLFSLCLKEFRKQKYAFPVLKVDKMYKCLKCRNEYLNFYSCPKCKCIKRDEIEIENTSYEGAIVFDPVPKVDYEACAVKDYMSLYPASIMHKNMCHTTQVENPEYDNLQGVTYFNAQYRENDGTIQYRRYAKIGDKLGVIPTILDNLLKERKLIKKQMGKEKDPFKYKILDAKQLAVKITANSLYGQLGASTSPVCKRDIAACTTSTGREMLVLAKKYDEETLTYVMNSLKYFYNNNEIEKVNKLYDIELKARNDEELIDNIKKYVTDNINNLTFQPVVRYGDSVIGSTPLLLRDNENNIFIKSIDNLTEHYNNYHNTKESSEIDNLYTWTEKGWTKIFRVIRHKLDKHKKLFRIITNSGIVVVTDDHSLLLCDGTKINPNEINIGTELLHSFPNINIENDCKEYVTTNELDALTYYYTNYNNNIVIDYINNNYIIKYGIKSNKIIKIEEYYKNDIDYVYDLTTENHHFQAGVGSLIVHNTDSIFSCYRFRENTVKVEDDRALEIFKNIITFARILIEPYFKEEERVIFNKTFNDYYSNITSMILPEGPKCIDKSTHYKIILPIEDRIKIFIKEYIEESYFPWLWTIAELVEKDYIFMFDIKLTQWAEHQLLKIRLTINDLYENRKNYIMIPIMNSINKIFDNKYILPSEETINKFALELKNDYIFSSEINLELKQIEKLVKTLMEKTIKDKWIFSGERKEITKLINNYLDEIIIGDKSNIDNISYYLSDFIIKNKDFEINKLKELLIKNLISDESIYKFNTDKMEEITIDFIENYIKINGKKSLNEIMEEFCEKELNLSFDKYKQEHYKKIINFITNNMRRENLTTMDKDNSYIYYWIQPRWDFIDNKRINIIDIYEGGISITDKRTLEYTMEMGKLSGELIKSKLPFPHDCEYEKCFWPKLIASKKRYVGNKYEFDPNKYKLDFMGIALKRRDNAAIVKEICSGIIDQLINHRSPEGAKRFTRKCLQDMFEGKYDIKYFLQSRTLKLKESYKDWTKIAHVYLADKISKRDPGNTPQSGDRIEFAVIKVPLPIDGKKLLQGDIIETPKFIKENNLEIDYLFYLTNQIMNPALQFLELVDKNAINLFKEFIDKYSIPKKIKIKEEKEIDKYKDIVINIISDKKNKTKKIKVHKALQLLTNKKEVNNLVIEMIKLKNEIDEFIKNSNLKLLTEYEDVDTNLFII